MSRRDLAFVSAGTGCRRVADARKGREDPEDDTDEGNAPLGASRCYDRTRPESDHGGPDSGWATAPWRAHPDQAPETLTNVRYAPLAYWPFPWLYGNTRSVF